MPGLEAQYRANFVERFSIESILEASFVDYGDRALTCSRRKALVNTRESESHTD